MIKIPLSPNEQLCKYFYQQGLDLDPLLSSASSVEKIQDFDVRAFREDKTTLYAEFSDAVSRFNEDTMIPGGADVSIQLHPRYMPVKSHSHEFIEFVYVYQGNCVEYAGEIPYEMSEGDLFLHAPGSWHHMDIFEDDCIVFHIIARHSTFDTVFLSLLNHNDLLATFFAHVIYGKRQGSYLHFKTADDRVLKDWIYQMYLDNLQQDDYSARLLNIQFEWLCVRLLRFHLNDFAFSGSEQTSGNTIDVLNYILDHYKDASLADVARKFHYSDSQLQRIIKKNTGRSFNDLLLQTRLKKACALLKNNSLTIQEVAENSGFHDLSNFHRAFKKAMGITPARYRKGHGV